MAPPVIPMGLDAVVEGLQYEVEGAGLFGESIPFKNFFAGCFERLAVLAFHGFPFVLFTATFTRLRSPLMTTALPRSNPYFWKRFTWTFFP